MVKGPSTHIPTAHAAPPTLPSVAASSGVSTSPHSAALMGALQSGSGQGTCEEDGGGEGL